MADERRNDGQDSHGRLLRGGELQISREVGAVCSSQAGNTALGLHTGQVLRDCLLN